MSRQPSTLHLPSPACDRRSRARQGTNLCVCAPPLAAPSAEEIVEEAWNATLLSCEKRFKGMVQSLELDLLVEEGIPRQAFLDAGRARQVITNIVGVRCAARVAPRCAAAGGSSAWLLRRRTTSHWLFVLRAVEWIALPHSSPTRLFSQNAIKFTAGGVGGDGASAAARQSTVGGGGSAPLGRVLLSAAYLPDERLLQVSVKDSGRGISEEGLAKLFKPCAPLGRAVTPPELIPGPCPRAGWDQPACSRTQPAGALMGAPSTGALTGQWPRLVLARRRFAQAEGPETKKRFGGSGLGLCISRSICQALGGAFHRVRTGRRRQLRAWPCAGGSPPLNALKHRARAPCPPPQPTTGDLTISSDGLGKGSTVVATMHLPTPPAELLHPQGFLNIRSLLGGSGTSPRDLPPTMSSLGSITVTVPADDDAAPPSPSAAQLVRAPTRGHRVASQPEGQQQLALAPGAAGEDSSSRLPEENASLRSLSSSLVLGGKRIQDSAAYLIAQTAPGLCNGSGTGSSGTDNGDSSEAIPSGNAGRRSRTLKIAADAADGRAGSVVYSMGGTNGPDDSAQALQAAGPPLPAAAATRYVGGAARRRGSSGTYEGDPRLSYVRVLAAEDDPMMRCEIDLNKEGGISGVLPGNRALPPVNSA